MSKGSHIHIFLTYSSNKIIQLHMVKHFELFKMPRAARIVVGSKVSFLLSSVRNEIAQQLQMERISPHRVIGFVTELLEHQNSQKIIVSVENMPGTHVTVPASQVRLDRNEVEQLEESSDQNTNCLQKTQILIPTLQV
jgi:hypothetical protein